jgi:pyruvate dehydrogenase E2 component (dihydrolipoamide acetyltransferase)
MIEFKMPSLGADMEDGTLIEWKSQATQETRRYNRRGGNTKGLIEIEIFEASLINSSFRKEQKFL